MVFKIKTKKKPETPEEYSGHTRNLKAKKKVIPNDNIDKSSYGFTM